MISDQLAKQLNDQMNHEFHSSHLYLALGAYCLSENLDGFANFFIVQAEEERFHALKFFHFLNQMNRTAEIKGFDVHKPSCQSVLACFEEAYHHEQGVTRNIYALSDLALQEREHATINFLKWFIDEQVEEENLFDGLIQKLKRIDQDSNAFFMLEAELAKRTFVPPANA